MELDRIYRYRFRSVDEARREAAWREIAPFIHSMLGTPERVLDPAAGTLEFLRNVPAPERWGVDLREPADASRIAGIRFLTGDALSIPLPPGHFDAVFVSNFLEHLRSPEEIHVFLSRMRDVLKPGGRIACMGPNFKFCADQYFDCADHRLALTHVSVEEHFHGAGLEVESSIPRFLPFSFRGGLPPHRVLVRGYLRFRWAWLLLGKQFLVIGRRMG